MKKSILFISLVGLLISCETSSDEITPSQEVTEIDMSDFFVYTDNADIAAKSSTQNGHEKCHTMQVLNRQLKENPGLYKKMYTIEKNTRQLITEKGKPDKPGKPNNNNDNGETDVDVEPGDFGADVTINVIVHVVWNTIQEQVSQQQINDQIAVLNNDFNTNNSGQLPSNTTFVNDVTVTGIHFNLIGTEYYEDHTRTEWGTRDAVKAKYNPINPSTTLNIWVCNIGGGILGYAQFPGGDPTTDGIVLLHSSLPGGSAVPYNEGRTATHEIGHYLNLRHIWGDGRCKRDDYVEDTPSSDGANYGCPDYPRVNCRTTDMTMNYMDYTDDACMYMFTDGQRNRMRAILESTRSGL